LAQAISISPPSNLLPQDTLMVLQLLFRVEWVV